MLGSKQRLRINNDNSSRINNNKTKRIQWNFISSAFSALLSFQPTPNLKKTYEEPFKNRLLTSVSFSDCFAHRQPKLSIRLPSDVTLGTCKGLYGNATIFL